MSERNLRTKRRGRRSKPYQCYPESTCDWESTRVPRYAHTLSARLRCLNLDLLGTCFDAQMPSRALADDQDNCAIHSPPATRKLDLLMRSSPAAAIIRATVVTSPTANPVEKNAVAGALSIESEREGR